MKQCKECGSPVNRGKSFAIYCSVKCKNRANGRAARSNPKNAEKIKAHQKAYQIKNQEKIKESRRKWVEENKEADRQSKEKWSNANRDKINEKARKSYSLNPEKYLARTKAYREQNKEAYAEYARRRKHGLKLMPRLSSEMLHAKMAYWGNKCWMCFGPFASIDHVKPISKGGLNILANIRPACISCNSKKNSSWGGPHDLYRFMQNDGKAI